MEGVDVYLHRLLAFPALLATTSLHRLNPRLLRAGNECLRGFGLTFWPNLARGGGFLLTSAGEDECGLDGRLQIPKCSFSPARVSESKGQPGVVTGLPRLGTNYRERLGFLVHVWLRVPPCVCVSGPVRAAAVCSLHNPLIR